MRHLGWVNIQDPHESKPARKVGLGSRVLIGSLPSCGVVIKNARPIHALLEWQNDEKIWILTDLEPGGLKVEGEDMKVTARVPWGGRIEIGGTELILEAQTQENSEDLFQRDLHARGSVLELVAYWRGVVLDLRHYPLDDSSIVLGKNSTSTPLATLWPLEKPYVLAETKADKTQLHLNSHMEADLRLGGKWQEFFQKGGTYALENGDLAFVRSGPIQYLLRFVDEPELLLPPQKLSDPFLVKASLVAMGFYVLTSCFLWLSEPTPQPAFPKELWAEIYVPPKKTEPLPPMKKIDEKLSHPQEKANKEIQKKSEPSPLEVLNSPSPKGQAGKSSEGARVRGGGVGQQKAGGSSGLRDPKSRHDVQLPGVQDGKVPHQASGINLDRLGLGVGKLSQKLGAAAVPVRFMEGAGGLGRGEKSSISGLGGVGKERSSLGFPGSDSLGKTLGSMGGLSGGKTFSSAKGERAISHLKPGDPVISGGLSQDEILAVINSHLGEVQYCYESALQLKPQIRGTLKLNFVIDSQGIVRKVRLLQEVDGLSSCIVAALKRWSFPIPRGGSEVSVTYPFSFESVGR